MRAVGDDFPAGAHRVDGRRLRRLIDRLSDQDSGIHGPGLSKRADANRCGWIWPWRENCAEHLFGIVMERKRLDGLR